MCLHHPLLLSFFGEGGDDETGLMCQRHQFTSPVGSCLVIGENSLVGGIWQMIKLGENGSKNFKKMR